MSIESAIESGIDLVARLWDRASSPSTLPHIAVALPPVVLLVGLRYQHNVHAHQRHRSLVLERERLAIDTEHKAINRTLEELDFMLEGMRTALRTQDMTWAALPPDAGAEEIASAHQKVEDLHCALLYDLGLALVETEKIRLAVRRAAKRDELTEGSGWARLIAKLGKFFSCPRS